MFIFVFYPCKLAALSQYDINIGNPPDMGIKTQIELHRPAPASVQSLCYLLVNDKWNQLLSYLLLLTIVLDLSKIT